MRREARLNVLRERLESNGISPRELDRVLSVTDTRGGGPAQERSRGDARRELAAGVLNALERATKRHERRLKKQKRDPKDIDREASELLGDWVGGARMVHLMKLVRQKRSARSRAVRAMLAGEAIEFLLAKGCPYYKDVALLCLVRRHGDKALEFKDERLLQHAAALRQAVYIWRKSRNARSKRAGAARRSGGRR